MSKSCKKINNEENTIRSLTRLAELPKEASSSAISISNKLSKTVKTKRYRKRIVRYGLLVGNIAVVIIAAAFVLYNPNRNSVNRNLVGSTDSQAVNPLDTLSSADIAVNAARMTNLAEATSVTNQADSVAVELSAHVVDSFVVQKPQILSSVIKTKLDIKDYTTVAGDNLGDLATRFGVTSDSIKWSNSLTSNLLRPGVNLIIPPIDGIAYTVKAGDTPDSLATKYNANKDQIIIFNDAEVSGFKVGERIVIPGGSVRATTTASYSTGFTYGFQALYGGNGYDYGWCTWYVASKIQIPRNWGNAYSWDDNAARSGWIVSKTPRVGSIAQTDSNHVGIVEEVSEDGSMIKYSDMNGLAGWGRVGYSGWVPTYSHYQRFIYR